MERSLVKQGRNALTLTLPAKWLKENNLQAGDTVQIAQENQQLRISTQQSTPRMSIQIDVKEDNKNRTWHKLLSLYIQGYDEIEIINYEESVMDEFKTQLIGMVIEKQTKKSILLKNIISVPENNIEVMIRRAAHMFDHQAELLQQIASKKTTFEKMRNQEYVMDSHIYYCLRHLHKYHNTEKSYRYFLLCAVLELAGDQLRYIAKYIGTNIKLAKLIKESVQEYTHNLFLKDLKELYTKLRAFRDALPQKTFVEGLAFTLADTLYNNIGYLIDS